MSKDVLVRERPKPSSIAEMMEDLDLKDTIVVNFFGGPGSGKSTTTAHTFAELKWGGVNCEMALEYAKDKVWEKSFKVFDSQLYISGKQFHRLNRLVGEVDVILTDSPILLGLVYNKDGDEAFRQTILNHFHLFKNINFYMQRSKIYNPKGRFQTESQAVEVDNSVLEMLNENNVEYETVEGSRDSIPYIVNKIKKELSL